MTAARSPLPILAALAAAALTLPAVAAGVADNEAHAHVESDDSAIASCQVLVLVNAVIVLELEDGLGLAARRAREPVSVVLPAANTFSGSYAECRVVVDRLRVLFPPGEDATLRSGSYVSGPPPVAGNGAGAPSWSVRVEGVESSAAICQHVVLVNSVVLGGGAYGMPAGPAASVLHVPVTTLGGAESAGSRCLAKIGSTEFANSDTGGVE